MVAAVISLCSMKKGIGEVLRSYVSGFEFVTLFCLLAGAVGLFYFLAVPVCTCL